MFQREGDEVVEDIDQEKQQEKPLKKKLREERLEEIDINVLSDFKDTGDDEDEIITPYKKAEAKKAVDKSPVQRQNSDKIKQKKSNNFVQASDPNTDRLSDTKDSTKQSKPQPGQRRVASTDVPRPNN